MLAPPLSQPRWVAGQCAHQEDGRTERFLEQPACMRRAERGQQQRGMLEPRGCELVLSGPQSVAFSWRSSDGTWHQERIGRESLDVWVMLATYSEGFWSRISPHAPVRAPQVFSGLAIKVYGLPSHRIVDAARFKAIIASTTETGRPASPAANGRLSWADWWTELRKALVNSGSGGS